MIALIDGDILRYEIGFAAETKWKDVSDDPPPFSVVEELLEDRIGNIKALTESEECRIFFTGSSNFRTQIATTTPYKKRPSRKPFHFKNIEAYLKAMYPYAQEEGLEADDLMAIVQTARLKYADTVICTRDKDLRQVEGYQFGWEIGHQPMFPMQYVDYFGDISLKKNKSGEHIVGTGYKFFCSQLLTGDPVDTVPGLPKCGPVKAFNALASTRTPEEALEAVKDAYKDKYGDEYRDKLLEQGRLLYLVRELDKDGKPIMWEFE